MGETCLTSSVYRKIKDRIYTLEFRPGQVLQERALAEMFDTSRTTVHSAVQKLECEGWLIINSRKNLVVKDVTVKDVNEIFGIRKFFEEYAVGEIFRKDLTWGISFKLEEEVVRFRSIWDDCFEYMRSDQIFHGLIVSVLDNDRIDRFYGTIREEFLRLGMMIDMDHDGKAYMVDAHMKILLSIREKDLDAARSNLLEHLERARSDAIGALEREKGK